MCDTVLIPCNKDHTASGTGVVDAAAFAWKVTKATWWCASNFTIGLSVIAVALYRATRWTALAVWRGYRWYATLPVNRGQQREPVAALTAATTAMTLADLRLKEPANR